MHRDNTFASEARKGNADHLEEAAIVCKCKATLEFSCATKWVDFQDFQRLDISKKTSIKS